jgi:hypothetical protein
MPFVLGVLMGVAGFALLVLGEIKLPGGRLIKGQPARRAAVVWLSFFPVVFLVSAVLRILDLDDIVDPLLVFWIVSTSCLCIGLGFVLPVWSAARPRQGRQERGKAVAANPFESQPAARPVHETPVRENPAPSAAKPEPWLAPTESKPGRRRVREEKNPFDFS